MRLIKPYVEIIQQGPGLQGIYNQIESAGRTCYKSEVKGGENAKTFVNNLIMNGHTAMLEFGTVYLTFPITLYDYKSKVVKEYHGALKYKNNPYSKIFIVEQDNKAYVTTNFRVIAENKWEDDLKYLSYEPTEFHYKRYTAKFVISIGIGREFLRHRKFSFANESTRFCNYSKEKFNNEITFIAPEWLDTQPIKDEDDIRLQDGIKAWMNPNYIHAYGKDIKSKFFLKQCLETEAGYLALINQEGCKPQQARELLPLCTKSELCMCGFEEDWRHFFDLRMRGTTGTPHPDARYIAAEWWRLLKEKFGAEL